MLMEIVWYVMTICVYVVCMGKCWEIDRRVSWIEDTMMTWTEDDDDDEEEET